MSCHPTTYHNVTVSDGTNVAYAEAGSPSLPLLLLLHGFPSSNNQYRNFIPLLAPTHHVIAPDLPGFGLTTTPANYTFTFANLASTIGLFLSALNITRYAVYIFDYGAPVGLRLALKSPDAITAIVSQNGNAYNEGFGHPFWDPIMALWENDTAANRAVLRDNALTLDFTKLQYTAGVPAEDLPLIDPVTYTYDYLQNIQTPAKQEIQLSLLYDYRTNVDLYPAFHTYFRDTQVPLFAIWGKGDPAFIPPGAEAFKTDLPGAKIEFVDSGHFALETKGEEIAGKVKRFLKAVGH
ncbi:MAG: hypothetical protein Q9191_007515 [Dirinaria sp. TL-2023a]